MYEALRILLKQDIYHGYEMLKNNPPGRFWLDCVEAKYDGTGRSAQREDFDDALGSYGGTTDMPYCFLWEELMQAYPEAKVVLVNRDFESWWRSFKAVVIYQLAHPLAWAVALMEPLMGTHSATMSRKVVVDYFGVSSFSQLTEERARIVFEQHYANIRKACEPTPGRLLEMRIEQGWEPLCRMLDKPKPSVLFPKGNELEAQHKMASGHRSEKLFEGMFVIVKSATPVLVAGVAVWWYFTS